MKIMYIDNPERILSPLLDAVKIKRPHLWESGDWLLHHNNVPAHALNLVQQYLASIVQIIPCDFWLFPILNMPLKGHRFDDIQTIKTNLTNTLKAILKSEYQNYFEK